MTKQKTEIKSNNIDIAAIKQKLIDYLTNYGYMKGNEFLKGKKPTHGECCTCKYCGYNYDDCICEHNEHLKKINEIFGINK